MFLPFDGMVCVDDVVVMGIAVHLVSIKGPECHAAQLMTGKISGQKVHNETLNHNFYIEFSLLNIQRSSKRSHQFASKLHG